MNTVSPPTASYDTVARLYDPLAALVFGKALSKARSHYTGVVKPGSRVLILGGGTGDVLYPLLRSIDSVRVDFVEPSAGMLRQAKKKMPEGVSGQVRFVRGDHRSIPGTGYDAAWTSFLLDGLAPAEGRDMMRTVYSVLREDGTWCMTDFFGTRYLRHRLIVASMYLFFRLSARIPARRLPDYDRLFKDAGMRLERETLFLRGLVRTRLYQKRA